ncbi:hypothetical protein FRC08_014417 [Ceratobasidium sp. 394]|nr:hypothetical protein FRC08_014417 [Ceratobasidium sp. 394]KAG9102114.1 hypothetical protein FS749_015697 [Ceratobasidium sp. UAMH 11750]
MTRYKKTARKSTGGKAPRMRLPPVVDSDDELPTERGRPSPPVTASGKDRTSPEAILEQPGSPVMPGASPQGSQIVPVDLTGQAEAAGGSFELQDA